MASNGAPALAQQSVQKEAEHLAKGDVTVNNWSQPGSAAFDFRSKRYRAHAHTPTYVPMHYIG